MESKEEKNKIREQNRVSSNKLFFKTKSEYDKRFKTEATLLFEEFLSRLPEGIRTNEYPKRFLYQLPTNSLGWEWVANNLEIHAKQLQLGIKYSTLTMNWGR